jgi:Reverse transcriptase (RNA-dependent DNA polymerase)
MEVLDAPVTMEEVVEVLQALPSGKAADAHGLTCELLRLAVARVPSTHYDAEDGVTEYVCEPLVACLVHVIQHLASGGAALPAVLQVSKLTPVPKSGQATARLDKNMYRGISVASIFSKVIDKLLHKRLDAKVEQLHLRANTQCGFRKGHGTLDALFTLTQAINTARYKRKLLYVVFVDFKKAFDTVHRDIMIDRCTQLGVHGPFLDTLMLLYDKVQQQVCIGGKMGRLFDTYVGTKQGSELSPLLFGMFIDVLHELILMQVPGAGPVVGNLQALLDIIYADDVTLIAYDNAQQAQHLLDCLSVFCAIFKMEVNQHELKTCAVVFRCRNAKLPDGLVLRYRGDVVPFKEWYKYLGIVLHSTKGLVGAADALAESGHKAMQVILGRCRQQCITQFDMKCRIFDRLVEPVMSYGSQIWGPDVFDSKVTSDVAYSQWSAADKVHISYLRRMAGVGQVSVEVLMRDFNRAPVMHHWVVLAARWFMTLRQMSSDRLAHCAWVADIELMLDGCCGCWTYKLLNTMSYLGVIDRATIWDQDDRVIIDKHGIMHLQLLPKAVIFALHQRMAMRWTELHPDPRAAPSDRVEMCTHAAWVLKLRDGSHSRGVPRHLKLCVSFVVQQCFSRLRLGGHDLQIRLGRTTSHAPRHQRLCRLCSTARAPFARQHIGIGCVEDVKHFLIECPAYEHVRLRYTTVFGSALSGVRMDMHEIFDCEHQDQLAHAVYTMTKFREYCLSRPQGVAVRVEAIQQAVEADIELIRIGT